MKEHEKTLDDLTRIDRFPNVSYNRALEDVRKLIIAKIKNCKNDVPTGKCNSNPKWKMRRCQSCQDLMKFGNITEDDLL